ncbi:hypothetical protein, partial [Flavobacterium frigidimaris]|uniref:hypothetical protein n=1 Tax=Flavobacterium frigidimaris TaxID=262320 RepID=UPI001A956A94
FFHRLTLAATYLTSHPNETQKKIENILTYSNTAKYSLLLYYLYPNEHTPFELGQPEGIFMAVY